MKLVNVLARELKAWPSEATHAYSSGHLARFSSALGNSVEYFLNIGQEPEDQITAFVTRAEWQAAVDALNAPKVVEWDGVGLPPVGVDCEVENEVLGGWDRAEKILAHSSINGKDVAVFQRGDLIAYAFAVSFRPILTPEQIAEEELQIATQAIMADAGITDSALKDDPEAWVWAAALHKAGYRKQVAP